MKRLSTSALLCGLLCATWPADAQSVRRSSSEPSFGPMAKTGSGTIHGVVLDLKGAPLVGATVSALGATSVYGSTGTDGRFALHALPAGPYIVRVHHAGFATSPRQVVDVRPSARAIVSVTLRRTPLEGGGGGGGATAAQPTSAIGDTGILAAGFALPEAPSSTTADGETADAVAAPTDDHSETAWRLRHLKRSILKETTAHEALDDDFLGDTFGLRGPYSAFDNGHAGAAAHLANLPFSALPLSGQFNFVTTSSFDSPSDLFSPLGFARNVAYVSIGAPVGEHGDWSVKGAMTQGDLASWFVAGSYNVRAPATHRYSVGMSYSTQRYDGGNPLALAAVSASGRNAGVLYGSDEWSISPAITLSYGTKYARYDYLNGRDLFSPRVSLEWTGGEHFRLRTLWSRRSLAPGAEEFAPPLVAGLWVPPERTFSSLGRRQLFQAETTQHYEVALEQDLSAAYVISFRSFYQRIDDQLSALFGLSIPSQPSTNLGHYYVINTGDGAAQGWGVGLRRPLANGLRGSVDYTLTTARWVAAPHVNRVLDLAPSVVRPASERFHDVTTSVEKEIPQTATRVFVMYKVNNGFAKRESTATKPGVDGRFDVQVNQSLPFLNFSSAEWEVLVAVRNMFRENMTESSVFDELQVVRPPKRIVGGVLVRF